MTNFSKSETIHIRKNQRVAYFTEANKENYSSYAIDLELLGEGKDPFVDLPTLYGAKHLQRHGLKEREPFSDDSQNLVATSSLSPCTCNAFAEECTCNMERRASITGCSPPTLSAVDKFTPFDADDVGAEQMKSFSQEELDNMSDSEIVGLFNEGPLKHVTLGDENNNLSDDSIQMLRILLLRNRDVFSINDKKPGVVNQGGCHIDTGSQQPISIPLRSTPPNLRPILEEKLDELQKYGVIEHSASPWGAAVLLVPKKDPHDFRLVIDFRLLNKATKKDAYPLPRIDDCLSSLTGNEFFSCLDLTSAFWQIPIASKEDREKTAFKTHRGHFHFVRMPMGLVNAPACMQRYIESTLSGLLFSCALVYVDDILIFSPTFEKHLEDLQKVFTALKARNFHLKAKKCEFCEV